MKKLGGITLIEIAILVLLQQFGCSDHITLEISILVLATGSLSLYILFRGIVQNQGQMIILSLGYGLRVLVMLVDVFGKKFLTIPFSGGDSEAFLQVATCYYQGKPAGFLTNYPVFLGQLFELIGQNRIMAQYVNILAWVLLMGCVLQLAKKIQVKEKWLNLVLAWGAFLPAYLLLSSVLLRESIMITLNAISFLFFLKWMKQGKLSSGFLAVLILIPSVLLHSGNISILCTYVLIAAFWNREGKRFSFSRKTLVLLLGGIAVLVVIYLTPLRYVFLAYFPDLSSKNFLSDRFVSAGADYLVSLKVENIWQFLEATVLRGIYFLLSPMPWDWRGLSDGVSFILDSVPFLLMLFFLIRRRSALSKEQRGFLTAGYWLIGINTMIYAWGVRNAGTAIRHRCNLVGIYLILLAIAFASKTKEVKEDEESITCYHCS